MLKKHANEDAKEKLKWGRGKVEFRSQEGAMGL